MTRRIYLDYAATTPTAPEVVRAMRKFFRRAYGNPSSLHESGLLARGSLEMARERIAAVLGCSSDEIVFTGSGTESNALAILGAAAARRELGAHVVTSRIEHSSVLRAFEALARQGFSVSYLNVDARGRFPLDELRAVLRDDTVLVSLGYANNEIGTVQDVAAIAAAVRRTRALLHLDAVQILPYEFLDLSKLDVDLLSFSGHKAYAPKGVGFLFVRRGIRLEPPVLSEEQEFGVRGGTENVPYIVGLSRAVQVNHRHKESYRDRMRSLRDRLIRGVLSSVPGAILTGDPDRRLPNHASFVFEGADGRDLVAELSALGMETSSGSACTSGRAGPSHVLKACGVPDTHVRGSLRVSLGRFNRSGDVDRFVRVLPAALESARRTSGKRGDGADGADGAHEAHEAFITQDEFRRRIDHGPPLQILDVRHVKYPRSDFPGAIHVPVWRLHGPPPSLDPRVETVVVCFQGDIFSPRVRLQMLRWGFTKVRALKGGAFGFFGVIP